MGIETRSGLKVRRLTPSAMILAASPAYRRASAGLGLQLVYTSRPPMPPAVAVFTEFLLKKLDAALTNPSQNAASR